MKKFTKTVGLLLLLCPFVFGCSGAKLTILAKPELKGKIFRSTRKALEFLWDCQEFQKLYPEQDAKLWKLDELVIIDGGHSTGFCGLAPDSKTIVLYTAAYYDLPGCYGELYLVIAHELLHIAGMPDHKVYENLDLYLKNDPIEKLMVSCASERGITLPVEHPEERQCKMSHGKN